MSTWKTASLGDIFDIARGGSPRPIQDYLTDDPAGVNWISISDASASDKFITATKKRIRPEGVSRSRMVKPGDFLLTNSMSFGRPYIMGTSGCIHDGWLVLSSKRDEVDQDYFFHLLGSNLIYAKFAKLAAGATVKNLNIDLVSGVEVSFPPLTEQRRIAAILDQAETLRTQRRAAVAQLDSLTQSIFLDMFGDPATNSKRWPRNTLKELGRVSTGGTPPSAKDGMFDGPIPFVTPGDLDSDMPVRRSLTEAGAAEVGTVRAGATLVCCIGATIGKTGRAKIRSAFNQQLNAVEWGPNMTDVYGFEVMRFFKPTIVSWGASTTLPILKKSSFERLEIPVPPLHLQREFSSRVDAIQELKAVQRQSLAKLDGLFMALQSSAFNGEL